MINNSINKILGNYEELELGERLFYRNTKKIILKEIYFYLNKNDRDLTIVDVGGCNGFDLKCIKDLADYNKFKSKIKFVVIDKNIEFYRIKKRFDFIEYFPIDIASCDVSYLKADIVICSEVIEHIWDCDKEVIFTKINEMMNVNGLLLMSTPNGSSIIKNLFALVRKNTDKLLDDFRDIYHHKGSVTIYQSMSILKRKGFELKNIKFTAVIFDLIGRNIFHRLINFLFGLIPYSQLISTNLVYVSFKKEGICYDKWYNQIDKVINK